MRQRGKITKRLTLCSRSACWRATSSARRTSLSAASVWARRDSAALRRSSATSAAAARRASASSCSLAQALRSSDKPESCAFRSRAYFRDLASVEEEAARTCSPADAADGPSCPIAAQSSSEISWLLDRRCRARPDMVATWRSRRWDCWGRLRLVMDTPQTRGGRLCAMTDKQMWWILWI